MPVSDEDKAYYIHEHHGINRGYTVNADGEFVLFKDDGQEPEVLGKLADVYDALPVEAKPKGA